MDRRKLLENPYRPGAGHAPPHLAGRSHQQDYFRRLLRQGFTTENILITGLRGVGKTVLLDSLRQIAKQDGWLWIGNDLSESSSLTEERLALRVLTDIAAAFSSVLGARAFEGRAPAAERGEADDSADLCFSFDALKSIYERAPGLPSDKLKTVLSRLGTLAIRARVAGVVFAYDEAQCLSDRAEANEFPMSMLIETIASLQRRDGVAPCLLVLSGLPQVFDSLTETRTYTERMFHVMRLERLSRDDTLSAILNPLKPLMPPLTVSKDLVAKAADLSGGYPYLIQFFGKELVDHLLANGGVLAAADFPSPDALDRLDAGLFASRWNRTTERQRLFLRIMAANRKREAPDFSAQEIVQSGGEEHGFTNAQASQMLQALADRGLVYRTRHGRYAFTVPMSEFMIARRMRSETFVEDSWEAPAPSPEGEPCTAGKPEAEPVRRGRGWAWFR